MLALQTNMLLITQMLQRLVTRLVAGGVTVSSKDRTLSEPMPASLCCQGQAQLLPLTVKTRLLLK